MLLFEILTGQSPFFGTSEEIEVCAAVVICFLLFDLKDDIIDGNFSIPHTIPRLARDLIRKLLTAGIFIRFRFDSFQFIFRS